MSDEEEAPATRIARFTDLGRVSEAEDLTPSQIAAAMLLRPVSLERSAVFDRPVPGPKPLELDITAYGIGALNKVTPEMLIAIVASIIATSPTARVAVARLRDEIIQWRFERSDGTQT